MKTILLYGDMRKKFGREFQLDVQSPAEAVRALCSQVKGFRAYLNEHRDDAFKVFAGGRNTSCEIGLPCSDKEVIRIAPAIQGAGAAGRIVLGVVLMVVSLFIPPAYAAAASVLFSVGASMAIGGVVQLLTGTAASSSSNATAEAVENTPSYNFNGPINTTAQGHPVPLCYGRMMVGSAVISAGLTTV